MADSDCIYNAAQLLAGKLTELWLSHLTLLTACKAALADPVDHDMRVDTMLRAAVARAEELMP